MLGFLQESGRAGERKLRLFALACCRRVWHLLKDGRSQGAIQVLERWVDGEAVLQEVMAAHGAARDAWGTPARTAVSDASAVKWEARCAVQAASHAAWACPGGSRAEERKAQANLLRCIYGNPFAAPPPIDYSWLRWSDGTVRRTAEVIYKELAFDRMPILADALLDAGCPDEEMMQHCRQQGGVHARGCWVLDLLLEKS
jgi:hypothetical protein